MKKTDSKKVDIKKIKAAQKELDTIRKEVSKVVVGQEEIINSLLIGILSDGHVMVEGIPGIAKTLIVRALAVATGCDFKRIQFTVDLLPSDIIGITTYNEKIGFQTIKGPIFTNFLIADEINRAPPKSQSALLEAMQERQTTIGKKTYAMMKPFFVMATQNPIETTGVYPLPEAQVDRFLFWVKIKYPLLEEEKLILNKNITLNTFESFKLKPVITPKKIIELQELAKEIYLDKSIERYVIEIVNATRHPDKYKISLGKYIEWGCSPRASIGLFIASKTDALIRGSNYVTPQNVKNVAYNVLRHRIILNYEGEAEGISTDDIIREVLSKVPLP
jgi:MoxR-like ATPase